MQLFSVRVSGPVALLLLFTIHGEQLLGQDTVFVPISPREQIGLKFPVTTVLWCRAPLSVILGSRVFIQFDRAPKSAGFRGAAVTESGTCAWNWRALREDEPSLLEIFPLTPNTPASQLSAAQVERRAQFFHLLFSPELLVNGHAAIGFAIDSIGGPLSNQGGRIIPVSSLYFVPHRSGTAIQIVPRTGGKEGRQSEGRGD
jgi:hypothetical protein